MTHTKKIITTIALIAITMGVSFAQNPYLDSIHIKIDDKIDISLKKYTSKDIHEEIKTDLVNLQTILSENSSVSSYDAFIINYFPNKSMTISPFDPIEYIDLGNNENVSFKYNYQCEINTKNYSMIIKSSDIEAVFSDNVYSKLKTAQDETQANQDRFLATHYYTFSGDEMISAKRFDDSSAPTGSQHDMILLSGAMGASLVGNQPLTDISASINFVIANKGILKNQYYVSSNMFYNFDEDRKAYTNTFLNLGYKRNLSNNPNKENWLGIEAGYLISRNGDFFDKNTFKFAVNWEVSKYISVSPQLYISGDLENVTPGIRVGFGF